MKDILSILRRNLGLFVGSFSFGLGLGAVFLGAWAWSIMASVEIPVGLGLYNQYPAQVVSYLGLHIVTWTGFVVVGVYMAGAGIIAISPRSRAATVVFRFLFRKKRNPFIKAIDLKLDRYIRMWIQMGEKSPP